MLKEDGKELIKLARNSINSYFEHKEVNIDSSLKEKYSKKQGCFVTLKINEELRGCIGYPEPVLALYKAITESAKSAAFSDPRFEQLSKEEFKNVKIEVSVLTVPEQIKAKTPEDCLKEIKIGRDGLIIRSDFGSGLLLPQVATEYRWNVKEFLEHLCRKAGLSTNAWKELDKCRIYRFQAEVFGE